MRSWHDIKTLDGLDEVRIVHLQPTAPLEWLVRSLNHRPVPIHPLLLYLMMTCHSRVKV